MKKLIAIAIVAVLALSFAACGASSSAASSVAASSVAASSVAASSVAASSVAASSMVLDAVSTLTCTVSDVGMSTITVVDEDGGEYSLLHEGIEMPADLQVGDSVVLTYTGNISDPATFELSKIERA